MVGNVAGIQSSDTAMLTRCGQAIQQTIQAWNGFEAWNYLRTIGSNISVVAATDAYALPWDLAYIYDVRLTTGSPRYVPFINRRLYDKTTDNQTETNIPVVYDLFRAGTEGKIQLIPIPSATDTLVIKYHRRLISPCPSTAVATCTATGASLVTTATNGFDGITIGTTCTGSGITAGTYVQGITSATTLTLSATATSSNVTITFGGDTILLDVPLDWQWGIIAGARHRFLMDKGTHLDLAAYWKKIEEEELMKAKSKNVRNPDEDLVFLPPEIDSGPVWNPNSVIPYLDNW